MPLGPWLTDPRPWRFLPTAAASAADAAESAIDPDAMSLDAALSVDEGPTRNTCTTEQRYPASPCPGAGWFQYTDTRCYLCGPSDPKCSSIGHYCNGWGDNRCYRQCKTNADCPDPCTPFCRELSLFSGGDHCGLAQTVCVHKDQNYCGAIPSDQHH
jgi:hypothetical protein